MNSRSDFDAKIRLALGLVILFVLSLLLLQLLLPWLLLGGVAGAGYWLWRRQRQRQQGRVRALDFAMLTQISGQEARDYLDVQAKVFPPSLSLPPMEMSCTFST